MTTNTPAPGVWAFASVASLHIIDGLLRGLTYPGISVTPPMIVELVETFLDMAGNEVNDARRRAWSATYTRARFIALVYDRARTEADQVAREAAALRSPQRLARLSTTARLTAYGLYPKDEGARVWYHAAWVAAWMAVEGAVDDGAGTQQAA